MPYFFTGLVVRKEGAVAYEPQRWHARPECPSRFSFVPGAQAMRRGCRAGQDGISPHPDRDQDEREKWLACIWTPSRLETKMAPVKAFTQSIKA